ncbi:MAG: IS1 family transposase [Acidobacteriota bacterium]|nr:IS1 family transposase [Acidobacteriota bacterium]
MSATNNPNPLCTCRGASIKWGKDENGHQRYRCKQCGSTFAQRPARPLGNHRIPMERAILVLNLLVEGSSIRAIERITGTHRDTVCRLLRTVGDRCAELLDRLVVDVEVEDVQADEIWGFVGMKQKTKTQKQIQDPTIGDSWCWTAVDRESKLVLAHHLGQRTAAHADVFMEKVAKSTAGRFQLSTDGLESYPNAVDFNLGSRADYGQIIKQYGSTTKEDQRRYSPASIIGIEKRSIHGAPDEDRICTSHVERNNLTIRTHMKRMTRLTCAFSKKWENLRAAFALHFAAHNFIKFHRSIRMTPAMKAGVVSKPWKMADLLAAS